MGVGITNRLTMCFQPSGLQKGHSVREKGTRAYRLSKHTHQELQESQDVESQGCHALWSLSPDQETKTRWKSRSRSHIGGSIVQGACVTEWQRVGTLSRTWPSE